MCGGGQFLNEPKPFLVSSTVCYAQNVAMCVCVPVYFSVIKATLFEAVGNVYFKKDWSLEI